MAALNLELCTLLVFLESPNVAGKTLALMSQSSDQSKYDWSPELLARNSGYARAFAATAASSPQRDQIHYAKELRNLREHWTDSPRLEYFRWYRKASAFRGGPDRTAPPLGELRGPTTGRADHGGNQVEGRIGGRAAGVMAN